MNNKHTRLIVAMLSAANLALGLMFCTTAALAQQPTSKNVEAVAPQPVASESIGKATPAMAQTTQTVPAAEEDALAEGQDLMYEPAQVGDATQGLLAWQRGGEIASATVRSIPGNVANRSYERYLKSFEYPIPEHLSSSVKSSSSAAAGSGAPK